MMRSHAGLIRARVRVMSRIRIRIRIRVIMRSHAGLLIRH